MRPSPVAAPHLFLPSMAGTMAQIPERESVQAPVMEAAFRPTIGPLITGEGALAFTGRHLLEGDACQIERTILALWGARPKDDTDVTTKVKFVVHADCLRVSSPHHAEPFCC